MNVYRNRPLRYPWPSTFYVAALALAFGLQTMFPLQILPEGRISLTLGGTALLVLGVVLIIWGLKTLLQHHTSILSTRSTNHLVTSGPFRLTRNPVYLGYTLVILAIGLLTSCPWTIAASLLTAALIHLYVVRREEKHLLARFGFDYERYCRRTRAWI
jgi:protein-S-isoprenylcysteine O-methyltransferase Ste14